MKVKFSKGNFSDSNNQNNVIVYLLDIDSVKQIKQDNTHSLCNPLMNFNFEGKYKEVLDLKLYDGFKKVVLVGVGEDILKNGQIKAINLGGFLWDNLKKDTHIGFKSLLKNFDGDSLIQNIYQGFLIKNYNFDKYLSKKDEAIEQNFYAINCNNIDTKLVEAEVEGINFAKHLINEPANVIYPKSYVEEILELKALGINVKVIDKKELEALKMNSLLSVALGNQNDPYVVVLEYNGDNKSKEKTALVGKGVTFDSGGYSLKPASGMMTMKSDMSGSACVCGVLKTLALRGAKVNVVGVVGLVENMVNSLANKPGDIVTAKNGKTIEVLNTDAEGRLVLADLLFYTQNQFNPTYTIDVATLTGAIVVSLGTEMAGLFSNNKDLTNKLLQSGEESGELLWNMPLREEYAHHLKSSIADLQNITNHPRSAGAIFGAMFLKEFVNDTPWAHIDIAGVAFNGSKSDLHKAGACGFGVRLLNNFIKNNCESK